MEKESKSQSAKIRRIEELLSSKSFKEARSAIAGLSNEDRRRMSARERVELLQAQSKLLLNLGKMYSAWTSAQHAMRILSELDDVRMRASTKLLLGRILFRQGSTVDAEQEMVEALVAFKTSGDTKGMRIVLSQIAHLQFCSGNLWRASEVLRQALAIDESHQHKQFANQDRRNLCSVLVLLGRFRESRHVLAQVTDTSTNFEGAANTELRQAMIDLPLLENEEALTRLEYLIKVYEELHFVRMRDVCIEYLAAAHLNNEDFDEAEDCCTRLLDKQDTSASAVAQTLRILTDIYIAADRIDEALDTAKKAEEAIAAINERVELGAIYRAYGQIYSIKGDAEAAREKFNRSIEILNETGARYELALTYFAKGRSTCYTRDERIQSLETARSLFTEMEVPKRVEQVENYLHDLKCNAICWVTNQASDANNPTVIAQNDKMKRIVALCEQIAGSDANVLLEGETGTGKDLLAQFIHASSFRTGEFVPVNSAAVPNDMIESELFGFAKGAFTGANRDKPGLIECANGGTLYLNEIADATPQLQAKLLEVIEFKRVRRLGEHRSRPVDFRLIAATNRDISGMLESGQFRRDLYYRLREVPISIPPLRSRRDDIPQLVRYFIIQVNGDKNLNGDRPLDTLCQLLSDRDWPGNVRELRSEIIRLWHMSCGDIRQMLIASYSDEEKLSADVLSLVLNETGWNRRESARKLGMPESTLRYHIRKLKLRRT